MSNSPKFVIDFTKAEIAEAAARIDLIDKSFDVLYGQRDDIPKTTKMAVYLLRLEKAERAAVSYSYTNSIYGP